MAETPLVSVVVPVYNRAHLIAPSVGSLTHQSYRNLDIILVDDCSTDDLEGAVRALEDSRVRIVRRETNGGASAARNTGVAAARGNLIAFHDSDDICVYDKIERQVNMLLTLSADYIGVYSSRLFFNEVTPDTYRKSDCYLRPFSHQTPLEGDLHARTLSGNIINFPTLLVNRDALLKAGPSDERLRNNVDWDLCLRLTKIGKIGFIPDPLLLTPTTLDPEKRANRISKSLRYHTKSFSFITGKLRRGGEGGPALANHYVTTAAFLIRSHRGRFARRYLRAAMAIHPLSLHSWVLYTLSYRPEAYLRLRAWRGRPAP